MPSALEVLWRLPALPYVTEKVSDIRKYECGTVKLNNVRSLQVITIYSVLKDKFGRNDHCLKQDPIVD